MKRSRFSDERIIGILKEHKAGITAAELCQKHSISDATFYKWRSKFGGMEVSEAKLLKALEDENRKLKKLIAELMFDIRVSEPVGNTDKVSNYYLTFTERHGRPQMLTVDKKYVVINYPS